MCSGIPIYQIFISYHNFLHLFTYTFNMDILFLSDISPKYLPERIKKQEFLKVLEKKKIFFRICVFWIILTGNFLNILWYKRSYFILRFRVSKDWREIPVGWTCMHAGDPGLISNTAWSWDQSNSIVSRTSVLCTANLGLISGTPYGLSPPGVIPTYRVKSKPWIWRFALLRKPQTSWSQPSTARPWYTV